MTFLWILHFACVGWMAGLIWLVQLVHYPLMKFVDCEKFVEFHRAHSALISFIVVPVMSLQLLSAVGLVLWLETESLLPREIAWICLLLSVLVFIATAIFSVPQHVVLGRGFSARAHSRLVQTNWVRTIIWSAHLGICFWFSVFQWRVK